MTVRDSRSIISDCALNYLTGEPNKDCVFCGGTGEVKEICFGYPGTIMVRCKCTKTYPEKRSY